MTDMFDFDAWDDPTPPTFGPAELAAVKRRGAAIRRHRMLGGGLLAVALLAVGSVFAATTLGGPDRDQRIVTADEGAAAPRSVVVAVTSTLPGASTDGPRTTESISVLHVDGTSTARILSLPRDLFTGEPERGHTRKLASVVAEREWDTLARYVRDDVGVEIDGLAVLDVTDIAELVNAVGGIDLRFSSPVRDEQSGFAIDADCHHLLGSDVVALLMSRRLEVLRPEGWAAATPAGDLGRVGRHAAIATAMVDAARSGGGPSRLAATTVVDGLIPNPWSTEGLAADLTERLSRVQRVEATVLPVSEVTTPSDQIGFRPGGRARSVVDRFVNGGAIERANGSTVSACDGG